ncbi:MAG: hypothetical protein KGI64_07445 [Xanthomonadaceae bacterium]|nr:hypothetical protein [Xanthomonadaceae bacterium]
MFFEIVGEIGNIQTIIRGSGIRELKRLKRAYGLANWRKCRGDATVRTDRGELCRVELHWYEAAGIGKREFKIKRFLD